MSTDDDADVLRYITDATDVPERYVPRLPNPWRGQDLWVNTRTGEEFKVTATPGTSRTWRFGSLD